MSLLLRIRRRAPPLATGLSEQQQVQFPRRLQEKFRHRRFCGADPPDFPNYEDAAFVRISAAEGVRMNLESSCTRKTRASPAQTLLTISKMARSGHPLKPLFKGEWE